VNALDAIANINVWLEDLHPLLGDLRPPHTPDEFLGLAAEHRAADDFDRAAARLGHDTST
jgi:hypothetical protein